MVTGAERAGGVLDQGDALGHRLLQGGPVERAAEQVHREDGLRARGQGARELREVEVHRRRVHVDEHGAGARERDDVRGRGERVRRHDHLVAGTDPEREHGEMERGGPGGHTDGVRHLACVRDEPLELVDERPHGQLPALEHGRDGGELLRAHVRAGEPDQTGVRSRSLYQEIVLARPSSRSTFASKPSSSRAFPTFGIRSSTSA